MNIKTKVEIKQEQKLLITPELGQAIEILEYTNLEILEYIKEQVESNPMLEFDRASKEETYLGEVYNYEDFNIGKEHRNIREDLNIQLNYMKLDGELKSICKTLINYIDPDGYLKVDDLKKEIGLEGKKLEGAIKIIQGMEPAGVGGRSLEESLILQLKSKGKLNRINKKLIFKYLKEIALGEIDLIAKREGNIDRKDIEENINIIKSLNPYPARNYELNQEENTYIYPDIKVIKEDSTLKVELIDEYIPEIYLNRPYIELLEKEEDPAIIKFLEDKLRSFLWLKNSIERREATIKGVCQSLVEFQYDFFYNDRENIVPLRYKDIAKDIDMHESTVSRVCKSKYIETALGIYPLTYFFNSSIKLDKGYISSINVKKHLLDIVKDEDKGQPLSDQNIADLLKKSYKIHISRRTIAKYRKELGIASSYRRKIK